jgi:hypothetical protein
MISEVVGFSPMEKGRVWMKSVNFREKWFLNEKDSFKGGVVAAVTLDLKGLRYSLPILKITAK